MANPEVGALAQDGIVDNNDGKYGGAVHAHHYEKYNVAHDEIAANGGRNRWHLQTYFDRIPYNDCYAMRDAEGVSVDYRFNNPDSDSDTDMDFENWEPQEWMLEDDNYSYQAGFSVGFPISPWLSADVASISMGSDGSSSNEVKEDPYNSIEAHVSLPYGSALPDAQDPSDGFKTDVIAYRGIGGESLEFSSEFEYQQGCNRSVGYYTTGVITNDVFVDIV